MNSTSLDNTMAMAGLLPSASLSKLKSLTFPSSFVTHCKFSTLKFPSHPLSIRKKNGFSLKASFENPHTAIENSRVVASVKKLQNEKSIVVIDNYDSFTYNLCQYIGELGCKFEVYRNDELTVEELAEKKPRGILISPGPGSPQDSGISLETVLKLGPDVPIFGVCMGLQCIGEAFGGKIIHSPFGVMHGKSSIVNFDEKENDDLFSGLQNPFIVGRYHSLVIEKESFPNDILEVTAWTNDGVIMAARHKNYRHIFGVQFHPESIMTEEGRKIVANFIKVVERFDDEYKEK